MLAILKNLSVLCRQRSPLGRALALAAIAGSIAAPAAAVPTGCALTTTAPGVVFDKAFATVSRDNLPASLTASAPIMAKCTSANGEKGSYRWTVTLRTLSFTMLSGTSSSTVVANVGRQFTAPSATLEVSEGMSSSAPQTQSTLNTTAQLWNLTPSLSTGKYLLSQLFDVTEEYCKWTGNHLTCKQQGTGTQYRANYTLTMVDPAPTPAPPPSAGAGIPAEPPPSAGASTTPSPGRGVKLNPWTVRGYAAKHRCAICDELRSGG